VLFSISPGQDLVAVLGDQDDVLPLAAWVSRCLHGPAVAELHVVHVRLQVEDRLNREGHTWAHLSLRSAWGPVVMHKGRQVKV
jgi:hypothetical protein